MPASFERKNLNIDFDTTELKPEQIRLIKGICSMLNHVMTTDDEGDYFDASQELMQLIANAVNQSNYPKLWANNPNIPYGTQALEFSFDAVTELINNNAFVKFDN